jgi:hypothetical protein
MKKIVLFFVLILGLGMTDMSAQNFISRTGEVKFFSHTPLEDIEALNTKVAVKVMSEKDSVRIVVPIIGFIFDKSLMQEHFHENYMETKLFPTATFLGRFVENTKPNLHSPGLIQTSVSGELTIHGVTQKRIIPCILNVAEDGKITATSDFMVKLSDHKIKVPFAVGKNIAEEIKVTFSALLSGNP